MKNHLDAVKTNLQDNDAVWVLRVRESACLHCQRYDIDLDIRCEAWTSQTCPDCESMESTT